MIFIFWILILQQGAEINKDLLLNRIAAGVAAKGMPKDAACHGRGTTTTTEATTTTTAAPAK